MVDLRSEKRYVGILQAEVAREQPNSTTQYPNAHSGLQCGWPLTEVPDAVRDRDLSGIFLRPTEK